MPLYFAYGSNMHREGLRARCPRSRPVGAAELPGHRFFLMATSGYASVRADVDASVHGLLIDLDPSDLAALDSYEDIDGGLYIRAECNLIPTGGGAASALVYLGGEREGGGEPPPGYMECVVAAAREADLPRDYVAALATLLPPAAPSPAASS